MAMRALVMRNIPDVRGGLIEAMLNKALLRMTQDIETAPDIAEWREVALQIRGKPRTENGELVDVDVEFVVKGKVPARVASSRMTVRDGARGERQLAFALDSDDNPLQSTIHDVLGDDDE